MANTLERFRRIAPAAPTATERARLKFTQSRVRGRGGRMGDYIDDFNEFAQGVIDTTGEIVTGGSSAVRRGTDGGDDADDQPQIKIETGAGSLCEANGGTVRPDGGCDYPEGSEDDPPEWLTKARDECAKKDMDVDEETGECIPAKKSSTSTKTSGGGGYVAPKKEKAMSRAAVLALSSAAGGAVGLGVGAGGAYAMKSKNTVAAGALGLVLGSMFGGAIGYVLGDE